jgi:hypothetical protein
MSTGGGVEQVVEDVDAGSFVINMNQILIFKYH